MKKTVLLCAAALAFGMVGTVLPAAEKAAEAQAVVKPELNPDWNIQLKGRKIAAGKLDLSELVQLEAIATDHFSNENKSFPSWALKFSTGGKTVLFSGDVAKDFHDFPVGNPADISFCELTHYPIDKALPVLAKERFGKLVFTHIGDEWHGKEAERLFAEKVRALPYASVMAHDGDEFVL